MQISNNRYIIEIMWTPIYLLVVTILIQVVSAVPLEVIFKCSQLLLGMLPLSCHWRLESSFDHQLMLPAGSESPVKQLLQVSLTSNFSLTVQESNGFLRYWRSSKNKKQGTHH